MGNAPFVYELKSRFRVTHPFHPRSGEELELLGYRRSWGQELVDGQDGNGHVVSLPLQWTDAAPGEDPWLAIAQDRSYFRIEDLLKLASLIESLEP